MDINLEKRSLYVRFLKTKKEYCQSVPTYTQVPPSKKSRTATSLLSSSRNYVTRRCGQQSPAIASCSQFNAEPAADVECAVANISPLSILQFAVPMKNTLTKQLYPEEFDSSTPYHKPQVHISVEIEVDTFDHGTFRKIF